MVACLREPLWYYHLLYSVATYLGGILCLLPCRLLMSCPRTPGRRGRVSRRLSVGSWLRTRVEELLSGSGVAGRIVMAVILLVKCASIVLYLTEVSLYTVTSCKSTDSDVIQKTWLGLNVFFILNYILRLTASQDKLYTWMDIYSFVDHFTIIPTFVSLYLGRNWIAFRYLRLLHLMELVEVLQLFALLKSRSSIRIAKAATIYIAVWFASSGFVHMSENAENIPSDGEEPYHLTYWDAVYWLLVTMSTVGYGDIGPQTVIGKVFIVLFIMGSLAMFSTFIPVLVMSFSQRNKFTKPYRRAYGRRHIVVCGHITYNSVKTFISNFMHEEAGGRQTDVVLVDSCKPSIELEAFCKRYVTRLHIYQGSVMDLYTLTNIKVRSADACLILADRDAVNADEEDANNVMRAVSLKNSQPDVRVIIQLLRYRNLKYLLSIPRWNSEDEVICIDKLKMGLLAQNCLAPGICTLLSNLFTMRSVKKSKKNNWMASYKEGCGNEIYTETLSEAFIGMTFAQTAEICFTEFGILLVAIDLFHSGCEDGEGTLYVSPGDDLRILEKTTGFFIAQDPGLVSHVKNYRRSESCAFIVKQTAHRRCSTIRRVSEMMRSRGSWDKFGDFVPLDDINETESMLQEQIAVGYEVVHEDEVVVTVDQTGVSHWHQPTPLQHAILTSTEAHARDFSDHVIVFLPDDNTSCDGASGLFNFVSPLRSSSIKPSNLKDIVLLVKSRIVLSDEWSRLENFTALYVLEKSECMRRDLLAVNVHKCSMCVILSGGGGGGGQSTDTDIRDRMSVLTTLSIHSMFGNRHHAAKVHDTSKAPGKGVIPRLIPVTTELERDSNVAFLDCDDDDDPDLPLYLTVPVASGRALSVAVLDGLLTCTYVDGNVLKLVRALITGDDVVQQQRVNVDDRRGPSSADVVKVACDRSVLAQLSLSHGPFENMKVSTYGELFVSALRRHRILCLGLYRLISEEATMDNKRFVITNPDSVTELLSSDRVFVLLPSNMDLNGNRTDLNDWKNAKSSLKKQQISDL